MTWTRVVTALVFIPLFYVLVKYLPAPYFFLLVALGALIGQMEFYRFDPRQDKVFQILGLLLGLILLAGFYLRRDEGEAGVGDVTYLVLGLALFSLPLAYLFLKDSLKETLVGVSVTFFGVIYVAWTLGHLIPLRAEAGGIELVFFVFLVTWAGDTGAYYTGRGLGRLKLAPKVSPGKTVEGAIGGLIASILVALVARAWFLPIFSVQETIVLGLVLGIFGELGDLVESMFKRSGGVKDSGWLIPGHGGVLDRVDSLIFTIPLFYYYVVYLRPYGLF
jgi:phosphatidate cytidylyltransferase